MNRRIPLWILAVTVGVLLLGLVLGKDSTTDDTSLANTLSKVFLTIGFLGVLVACAMLTAAKVRRGRAQTA